MKKFAALIVTLTLSLMVLTPAWGQERRTITPMNGERLDQIVARAGLKPSEQKLFVALNWRRMTDDDHLLLDVKYSIPNESDRKNAQKIIEKAQKERKELREKPKESAPAKVDAPKKEAQPKEKRQEKAKEKPQEKPKRPTHVVEPLFGKANERVEIVDRKLEGATYYLVSGHGGPDPGALATYKKQTISEDEYAYDVILRLARQLMSHGAKVHIIIQDPDDGIREDKALACDDHETCMGEPIPLDQVQRLRQRADRINELYAKERKGYCRSVFIHVDSRSKDERIDIFFYHYMKSARGERLAHSIRDKLKQKYKKHQPYRGFSGEISVRDLFVLRETNPAGVFIEIGNIQNDMDMVRLVKPSNREAMARWIAEGMIDDYKKD